MRRSGACALTALLPMLMISSTACRNHSIGHFAIAATGTATASGSTAATTGTATAASGSTAAATGTASASTCAFERSWLHPSSPPADVSTKTTSTTSCPFNQFSWQSFFYFMQPAGGGKPLNASLLMPEEGVFVGDGGKPTEWGQPYKVPSQCQPSAATLYLGQIDNTTSDASNSTIIEAQQSFPLVDQNGHWVHYGVHLNRAMYRYLRRCSLWQTACFNNYISSISFPPPASSAAAEEDSIDVKTAWRVLETCKLTDSPKVGCKPDDPSHFYTALAAVEPYSAADPSCKTVTVGLVGMHIVSKTPSQPGWIWSTFENRYNDPLCSDATSAKQLQAPKDGWLFYNPNCSKSSTTCTLNTYYDPCSGSSNVFDSTCTKSAIPTQVCLEQQYGGDTTGSFPAINRSVHSMLPADSRWRNYYLVGTEWGSPPSVGSHLTPTGSTLLANSTAETYIQATTGRTDSCYNCHTTTTTSYTSATQAQTGPPAQADYSHLFDNLLTTSQTCTPPKECKLTPGPSPAPQPTPSKGTHPFRSRHKLPRTDTVKH
jgi:hypothetical protein